MGGQPWAAETLPSFESLDPSFESLDRHGLIEELLSLPELSSKGLVPRMRSFIARVERIQHPQSTAPASSFTTWPSYDTEADAKWAEIIPRETLAASKCPNIPDPKSSLTVKPSFTLDCMNWIQWHWPPFSTAQPEYGETADVSNGCTRQQFEKFPESTGLIFISDRIWRRFKQTDTDPRAYQKTSNEFRDIHEKFHKYL